MRRRTLIQGAIGALLPAAPAVGAPRDDSAYVQGLIDAGQPILGGTYHLTRPLRVGKDQTFLMERVTFTLADSCPCFLEVR